MKKSYNKFYELLLSLIGPIVFVFFVVIFFIPTFQSFQLDSDEGFNLVKAMLVAQDYELYSEIWSDQPPLFTYLLLFVFKIFGFKVGIARAVVLVSTAVLLWTCWQFMRLFSGYTHAFLGILFIALQAHFIPLSISSMVGMPMLTTAMISLLFIAFWHKNRNYGWLGLSAVFLSISILIKLQSGFFAFIFIIGLIIEAYVNKSGEDTWLQKLRPAIFWSVVFSATLLTLLLLLVGMGNIGQLINGHLTARSTSLLQSYTLLRVLDKSQMLLLFVPTIVGAILIIKAKKWLALYLLAWLVTISVLLINHIPVWYHHSPLVTIPIALLSAYATGEAVLWLYSVVSARQLMSRVGFVHAVVATCIVLFGMEQGLRLADVISSPRPGDSEQRLLVQIADNAPNAEWMVTDIPMVAFRTGIPVPPHLAVLSLKRMTTGSLSEQDVLEVIRELKPELVYLARFEWPSTKSYLNRQSYKVIHVGPEDLYVRQ